jgi:two-component system, OmpR family, phosphate regulon response regulator OmpR
MDFGQMTDRPHILVIDDDKRIRELLREFLVANNYLVSVAGTAAEARERMRGLVFDAMILDVMMPGETGISFAASLERRTPILMLSALSESQDRIAGLPAGVDDYLSKPFEPQELLLRLQNLLRRAAPKANGVVEVKFGTCIFNPTNGSLTKDQLDVRLTSREKDILRLLSQKNGQPLSRLELAQSGGEDSARSVDVQITRLRQKIEVEPAHPKYLQTIRGLGYALFVNEA